MILTIKPDAYTPTNNVVDGAAKKVIKNSDIQSPLINVGYMCGSTALQNSRMRYLTTKIKYTDFICHFSFPIFMI